MEFTHEQIERAIGILHEKSVQIELFGKTIDVQPPVYETIEEACRYLSLLPKMKTESMAELIANAANFQPMFYAIALMLYGVKHCERRRFWLFGERNIERIARKLKRQCTADEIRNAIATLLGSQISEDFFALVSAMMAVLIVETK